MLNSFTVNKTVLSGTCNNTDQCNGCLRTLQSWYTELNILSCASFVLSNVCTIQTWVSLEFWYVLDELDGSFLHAPLLQFEIVCIRPCLCMWHAISRQLMGACGVQTVPSKNVSACSVRGRKFAICFWRSLSESFTKNCSA